jgi:flagellum-specific ATP synthase
MLSRALAQRNHYPAIDVLQSISRLAPAISGPVSFKAVGMIRRNMAVYAEAEDLINVGAYHQGSNPAIDEAIGKHQEIENFLIQAIEEKSSLGETLSALGEISGFPIPEEEMADFLPRMPDSEDETEVEAEAEAEAVILPVSEDALPLEADQETALPAALSS